MLTIRSGRLHVCFRRGSEPVFQGATLCHGVCGSLWKLFESKNQLFFISRCQARVTWLLQGSLFVKWE